MFCRIVHCRVSAENLGSAKKWYKEQWAPLISKQEGLKGAHVMTKPNGEIVVIIIMATEAQLNAWNDNPEHKLRNSQFLPLLIDKPTKDVYEVIDT